MRRIQILLALLVWLVATLTALELRSAASSANTPLISHRVNSLVATFDIPLQTAPGTVHAIPGWLTIAALASGLAFVGWRLAQRARSNRS